MAKPTGTPGAGSPTSKPEAKGKTGPDPIGHCSAQSCKKPEARFSFCGEHYDQFKFGLITKHGKPVPDYEKKFGQYEDYKKRIAAPARKAA